jgi:hypothetical protein
MAILVSVSHREENVHSGNDSVVAIDQLEPLCRKASSLDASPIERRATGS